jgi:iron complex outermembrane receptor protein
MMARSRRFCGVSAAALFSVCGVANAQEVPETLDHDIVVTANRVESLASKTAISLTATSAQQLQTQQITDPTRLADLVPNLNIDRANGLQITIRGVTSTDGTDKGDPSAAFLLDGIYIARPQAQEVSFFDIDRVEVLRGPQGTLYGRNTTAGVINIIAKKPSFDFGGSLDVNIGNYGARQTTAVINMPVSDTLAVRLAGNYDVRESYAKQIAPQNFSLPKDKNNLSARASVLYNPTDTVSLLVQADYARITGAPSGLLLSNFFQTPLSGPASGDIGPNPIDLHNRTSAELGRDYADVVRARVHNKSWGVMAQLDVALSDAVNATYLGGYRQLDVSSYGNFYFGSIFTPGSRFDVIVPVENSSSFHQQSHELRLAYSSGPLKAQVGAYFFKETYELAGVLYGLLSPTPNTPGYIYGFLQNPGGNRSIATFGQLTYSITDQMRLTGGIRWTEDKKSRTGANVIHSNIDDPFNPATDSINQARLKTRKVIWKSGIEFDATHSTLLYGTISTGYKVGCGTGDAGCASPLPDAALYYKPETLTSYEIGIKTKAFSNKLRISADYFHYDYDNLQLTQVSSVCGVPCQLTTNAAKAKVDGAEIEGTFALNNQNQLDFSGTWLNARYSDWEIVPGVNLAGLKLDRSPKFALTGGYSFTQPINNGGSIVASIRTRYVDHYGLLSTALRTQFIQPSFTRTTASITYNAPDARWYAQVYVRNIENKLALTTAAIAPGFPGLNNGTAGVSDPRTYGVRAGLTF